MKEISVELSENETKLLNELCRDSSQSNGRLAKKLHVHHTTILRIKRSLEEKLNIRYTLGLDMRKVPSLRLYFVFLQLAPGARDNPDLDKKMEEYYKLNSHVIGHGKCIHGKWDQFTVLYCSEKKFDEFFNEFKSRMNFVIEEMDIIKTMLPPHTYYLHIPPKTFF